MRLCYYPAPSRICPFTHVTRERLPTASCGLRKALWCDLPTYVGIVNRSESVTHVTAQNLHAATQARCGVTRVTRKNLHAANFVTCPPVRRNIPGFSVDPPLLASGVRKVSCSRARRRHAVVWNWIMLQWAQRFSNMQHPVFSVTMWTLTSNQLLISTLML